MERTTSQHTQMSAISVTEMAANARGDLNRSNSNEAQLIKAWNKSFQYRSFLRLRNMMYLCLMLKSNPTLRRLRYHYLVQVTQNLRPEVEVQTFGQFWDKKIGKRLEKIKLSLKDKMGSTKASPAMQRKGDVPLASMRMMAPPMMGAPMMGAPMMSPEVMPMSLIRPYAFGLETQPRPRRHSN